MKLTAKYLIDNYSDNVNEGINYAHEQKLPYPEKPKQPFLTKGHNMQELANYSAAFKEYEEAMPIYKKLKEEYQKHDGVISNIIEEFIKDVSGFNKTVPDDKKSKVYSKAWEDGHSSGYYEVYLCLLSLVELFD